MTPRCKIVVKASGGDTPTVAALRAKSHPIFATRSFKLARFPHPALSVSSSIGSRSDPREPIHDKQCVQMPCGC